MLTAHTYSRGLIPVLWTQPAAPGAELALAALKYAHSRLRFNVVNSIAHAFQDLILEIRYRDGSSCQAEENGPRRRVDLAIAHAWGGKEGC